MEWEKALDRDRVPPLEKWIKEKEAFENFSALETR